VIARDGARHLLCVHGLSVNLQHTGAALRDAGAVIREVEHDRMLARGERLRSAQRSCTSSGPL
jgi:hypothetical protein